MTKTRRRSGAKSYFSFRDFRPVETRDKRNGLNLLCAEFCILHRSISVYLLEFERLGERRGRAIRLSVQITNPKPVAPQRQESPTGAIIATCRFIESVGINWTEPAHIQQEAQPKLCFLLHEPLEQEDDECPANAFDANVETSFSVSAAPQLGQADLSLDRKTRSSN